VQALEALLPRFLRQDDSQTTFLLLPVCEPPQDLWKPCLSRPRKGVTEERSNVLFLARLSRDVAYVANSKNTLLH
jgi:hypothetical protein